MSYSNKEYFLTKINQAELDKLTNTTDANLDAAIASADSLIDSYLITRIKTLPLTTVPEFIKQISYDIALFYLHDRIQYIDIPEFVKTKFDAAVFWLKDFARGQANIPGLASENTDGGISYSINNPIFNRKTV
jgi:phage gp36-like protein